MTPSSDTISETITLLTSNLLLLGCLGWYCGARWRGIHQKVDQEGRVLRGPRDTCSAIGTPPNQTSTGRLSPSTSLESSFTLPLRLAPLPSRGRGSSMSAPLC